jgi:hypothetical protein
MSWNALPWWVYECMYQREIMLVSGAMIEELYSGMTRALPEHIRSSDRSVFATHEPNGWNFGRISNCYDSLTQG